MSEILFKYHNDAKSFYKDSLAPQTSDSAGIDLRAYHSPTSNWVIEPGKRLPFHSGVSMQLPPKHGGFLFSRSGLGAKKGAVVAQGVGVIDSDYRGEIIIYLLNTSKEPITIRQGERVAQLVIMPCPQFFFKEVDALSDTERGENGFGHTGSL